MWRKVHEMWTLRDVKSVTYDREPQDERNNLAHDEMEIWGSKRAQK